jgi:hypothetical protein
VDGFKMNFPSENLHRYLNRCYAVLITSVISLILSFSSSAENWERACVGGVDCGAEANNYSKLAARSHSASLPSGNYANCQIGFCVIYSGNGERLRGSSVNGFPNGHNGRAIGPTVFVNGSFVGAAFTAAGITAISNSADEGLTYREAFPVLTIQPGRKRMLSLPELGLLVVPGGNVAGVWASQNFGDSFTRVDDGSFPAAASGIVRGVNGKLFAFGEFGIYSSDIRASRWSASAITKPVTDIFAGLADGSLLFSAENTIQQFHEGNPQTKEFARGLPRDGYEFPTTDLDNSDVVIQSAKFQDFYICASSDCRGASAGGGVCTGCNLATVAEFYNATLDHYFISADPAEQRFVDAGGAGTWTRTGRAFNVLGNGLAPSSLPVCRFYGSQLPGPNSHFYSIGATECNSLLRRQLASPETVKRWNTEGVAFRAGPPTDGSCALGFKPVFRAYNNGFAQGRDSNHRFSPEKSDIAALVAKGWLDEGVAFCVPA